MIADYSETPQADFSAAMMALGMIVSRTRSELALTLLGDHFFSSETYREHGAALGLALSGDTLALDMLHARAASEINAKLKNTFQQAIKENGRVSYYGLKQYYLQPQEPIQRKPTREDGQGGKDFERR